MSDLLRLLKGNERMNDLLKTFWLKNLNFCFSMFYIRLKKNVLKKWANCSFPLFWWAMWVNRSFCSNQMSDVSESLIFGQQIERFARKSNERIPSSPYATPTTHTFRVPGSAGTAGTDPSMDSSFWELFRLTPFRPFRFSMDLRINSKLIGGERKLEVNLVAVTYGMGALSERVS